MVRPRNPKRWTQQGADGREREGEHGRRGPQTARGNLQSDAARKLDDAGQDIAEYAFMHGKALVEDRQSVKYEAREGRRKDQKRDGQCRERCNDVDSGAPTAERGGEKKKGGEPGDSRRPRNCPTARPRQQFSRRAEQRRGKGYGEEEKHQQKVDADRSALKMGAENIPQRAASRDSRGQPQAFLKQRRSKRYQYQAQCELVRLKTIGREQTQIVVRPNARQQGAASRKD